MAHLTPLILLGTGGFAREVVDTVHAINSVQQQWLLAGYLDDNAELQGKSINGLPVLGTTNAIDEFPNAQVIACMGNPSNYFSRKHVVSRLDLAAERYATIIHPMASVGASCTIGRGTAVLAGAVLTAGVSVGNHVAVMPHVLLTHEDAISDFVSIAGGARLAGAVRAKECSYIGSGATIDSGITVGENSQIGAVSYVRSDVPSNEIWWGTPARFQRKIEAAS